MRLTGWTVFLGLAMAVGSAAADYRRGVEAWVRADYGRAAAEFGAAAQAGDAEAQYMMGRLCALGNGVPQDFRQAWRWYDLAARQGHGLAMQARDEMAAILPQAPPPVATPLAASVAAQAQAVPASSARPALVLVPRHGAVVTVPASSGQSAQQQAAR